MKKTVWIDYPESAFSKALAGYFEKNEFEVVCADAEDAGKYTDHIDIAVFGAIYEKSGDSLEGGIDLDRMNEEYKKIAVAPMVKLQFLLPLLDRGTIRRICFLTNCEASINQYEKDTGYATLMACAALHNHAVIAYNKLAPDGYTLRVIDPAGAPDMDTAAGCAYAAFTRNRGYDPHNDLRIDERVPKMTNWRGAVIPW